MMDILCASFPHYSSCSRYWLAMRRTTSNLAFGEPEYFASSPHPFVLTRLLVCVSEGD
jgi:hypothetical protein